MAVGNVPADRAESAAECVSAILVHLLLRLDRVERTAQCRDRRLLQGQEHTEVDLTAQLAESCHHVAAANQKADSAAGHVEALGQAEKLHADIHRAGRVKEAVPLHAVENNVAVCVVMNDEHIVLLGKCHDLLVQFGRTHAAHGVGRQRNDHVLRSAGNLLGDVRNAGEKAVFFRHRVVPRLGARHFCARDEHGIARRRQQHGVALVAEHHADVSHALLAAVAAGDLIGCDHYAEAALIILADRVEQFGNIPQAVFPVIRVHCRVRHGTADMLGRFKIGRADTEIVYRAPRRLELYFFHIQCGEDLVAKPIHSL